MQGLYYLASLMIVLSVFYWCFRNDHKREDAGKSGLFAFRNDVQAPVRERKKQKFSPSNWDERESLPTQSTDLEQSGGSNIRER